MLTPTPSRRGLFAILLGGLSTLVAFLFGSRKSAAAAVVATPPRFINSEPVLNFSHDPNFYPYPVGIGGAVEQQDCCYLYGTSVSTDLATGRTTHTEIDTHAGQMRTREYDAQGQLLSDQTSLWPPRFG